MKIDTSPLRILLHAPTSATLTGARNNAHSIYSCIMRNIAVAGLLCVAVATATAQPAKQGQQIAAQGTSQGVAACISCHGAKGEGLGAFPRLAGTGQAYLLAQLDAFAGGSRKNPIMQPIAQNLTSIERQAVALYFSQLPPPFVASDPAQPLPSDTAAWLATRGRWADQVPACAQCHGPGGSGIGAQFPPLAGLPAAYIAEQLQAWKAGKRPPGPLALMSDIAKKLSDAEVSAVAAYYEKFAASGAAVTSGASVTAEPAKEKAKGRP